MERYSKLFTIFVRSVLLTVVMTACVDDLYLDENGVTAPKGEVTVNIEAAFEPFSDRGINQTRADYADAPNGNIMSDISDVVLLAYDTNGDLVDGFPMELPFTTADIKYEDRTNTDASSGTTAETSTQCLTKQEVKLLYGTYYLIAVANMGEYKSENGTITTKTSTFSVFNGMDRSKYNTLDKLRRLRRKWDNSSLVNNREMCGFFFDTEKGASTPNFCSDFQPVEVNRAGMTLRTWLRRTASKVTVDFDGSGLRENVKIYIKDVKIYDLADSCTIGFGKTRKPGSDDEYIDYNNAAGKLREKDEEGNEKTVNDMIHEGGHVVNFYNMYKTDAGAADEQHADWPMIAKGSPYIYDDPEAEAKNRRNLHANNAPSLFFYENMQGDAPNGKGPIADLTNGGVANKDVEKENVPYGTYIEVTAFYESEASGNLSNGPIKYRFMLGKDAIKSCDAERNYHYKVTLKFNGNANDYSWHVDYKEDPDSWEVPTPWYVPYLYGQTANVPFKYTPPVGYEVVYFETEIEKNNWFPELTAADEATLKANNPAILVTFENSTNKSIAHGFLSLRQMSEVNVTSDMCGASQTQLDKLPDYGGTTLKELNEKYFTGKAPNGLNQSRRIFDVLDGTHIDTQDNNTDRPQEEYSYRRDNVSQSVELNMPVFTRPKSLLKQSGYTGNNPFVGYHRKATIKVTPYIRKIKKEGETTEHPVEKWTSKEVEVTQVRRIVNPKGIYRRSRNNEDFKVQLLHLPSEFDDNFQDFTSNGPWMAEIFGDQNFITLDGKQQVYGSTGSSIQFTVRFNKLNLDDKVRNAVIRVKYHSYTCTHLIFVRQGYDPQAICETAYCYDEEQEWEGERPHYAVVKLVEVTPVKWATFNRLSKLKNVDDPRDEGSLFKFGNNTQPIDAFNNCYGDNADGKYDGIGYYGVPNSFDKVDQFADAGDYASDGNYYLTNDDGTIDTKRTAWGDIAPVITGFPNTDGWNKMATMRDLEQLYATPNIQYGFGVLYADGATSTQTNINDAYGYYRGDPNRKKKGMRGVFVYYMNDKDLSHSYTGKNIFFPIGRSGYGHRKEGLNAWGGAADNPTGKGVLRYYCAGYENRGSTFDGSAPFFSQLYFRQGGIYYAKNKTEKGAYYDVGGTTDSNTFGVGLDLNYFSLDMNAINIDNLPNGKDACLVRFIE